LQAGLELGLQLDWLRPKGAAHAEVRSGAVMSIRIRGRYRELAMWLETLQHLHEPITVHGLTLRSADGPAPGDPSDAAGQPLLTLETTLKVGPVAVDLSPVRDAIRDPFEDPLRARAGSKAHPHERAARLGLSPRLGQSSGGPDSVRGRWGEPQWVGQLGRAGEAWTLLQVDGRVQAARNGAALGMMESRRQPLVEDTP
jgi:hypothetical protein